MRGIGTDILAIHRMDATLSRTGDRFAARILTEAERDITDAASPRAMAKAFAAKEAVAKALGTGFRNGVSWQDISLARDELGKPTVTLSGQAQRQLTSLGGDRVLLSIADEQEYVVAFAVVP